MRQTETEELLDRLGELFPKAKFQPAELAAWGRMFYRSGYEASKIALEKLWEDTKFNRPAPSNFVAIVQGAKAQAHGTGVVQDTDVWIQCVKAPEACPALLGCYVQVFAAPLQDTPHEILMHAADEMVKLREKQHGGDWQITQAANHMDMMRSRCRLRGESYEQ